MTHLLPSTRFATIVLAAGILAWPAAADANGCKQIHGQIVSDPILGCAASPIGLCTAGTFTGNRGLRGTTSFVADSAAPGPPTAPNPAWTISYSGILQISTADGTLVTRDTGTFDQLTGLFASYDVIDGAASSGRFAGASGLLFAGGETVDGRFVTRVISGEICFE
jgi:hypothetical protein